MRLFLAILVGKLISFLTKSLNLGGGSAAPGLYALKIEPKLVEKLVTKIPKNVVITGTNGKTTTSRMVAEFAKESGLKVIRNHTGSNLERGIASALISNYHLVSGISQSSLGIWELDEAAFNTIVPKLKPDLVVFLNISRDQLDRYGEVNSVIKKWINTLSNLPKKTTVLLNGDDRDILKLKANLKGNVATFGIESDKLDFQAKNIKLNGLEGSTFQLTINDERLHTPSSKVTINLPLPGIYHIYDAIAAMAAASYLKLRTTNDQLTNYQPAFGRFEKLPFGAIFLIKNPAGATAVFETLASQLKPNDRLLLALNDNLADGTDVSWIWDADFERLCHPERSEGYKKSYSSASPQNDIYVSGIRAAELAVRLKYAGFSPDLIKVIPSLEKALESARKGLEGQLYILPTYTAMLEIQSILVKIGIKGKYWKDN